MHIMDYFRRVSSQLSHLMPELHKVNIAHDNPSWFIAGLVLRPGLVGLETLEKRRFEKDFGETT